MPSSDKQLTFSVKIAASRELLNKGGNIVNMSQGTSPLPKDKVPGEDPLKAVSTKRLHSDAPSSPGYHNVYVRRKVEIEHSKLNSSQELKGNGRDKAKEQEEQQNVEIEHSKVNSSQELKGNGRDKTKEQEEQQNVETEHSEVNSSQELKGNGRDKTKEQEEQQTAQVNKPEVASTIAESEGLVSSEMASPIAESGGLVPSESPEKTNAEIIPEKNELPIGSGNEPPIASDTTVQGDMHRSSNQNQYWSERYNRLQTYLENCDRSTQEGYMRMLRSLSAAGRSMHAIELEKRAIHLLVEEGKELQRMKALNVLGKVSPNGSSKQAPLQRQFQK